MTKLVQYPSGAYVLERDADRTPVLETYHLGIDFGGLSAVNNFNIIVGPTEISGLIGPNGAGKTTVFNLLTKVYQPSKGTILVNGHDTSKMSTVDVNKAGVARTFQNIRLFENMSVVDNVKVAMHNSMHYNPLTAIFRTPKYYKEEKRIHQKALELLDIFNMSDLAETEAGLYLMELKEN